MNSNEVPVSITFRHLDSTDAIREHLEKKLSHVLEHIPAATDVHVILGAEIHHHRKTCEIVVHASHTQLTAHDEEQDLYAAIDRATAKLDAQARKLKGRVVKEARRSSSSRKAS
ncbi:MAG: ribosome-associated translation inhibitor RaiA [Candidatus Binatia bacterium]|nr:ribosome-associated translation inhibitor RaiA [Candidatus Binatia bacterium]MDG1959898.1 ribosome-associated translation inhibitor RaiA [Candidatus Binatia bacterium]MDG2010041.1 ribosome-associated translation inhibitor RaiA [Candidatus Binatia bacterium]HAC80720.1 ribosome-associated translation inhibitor RaiA [Deltaproteobacteria bacterium]